MPSLCKEKGLEVWVRALDPSRGASHIQLLQLLWVGVGCACLRPVGEAVGADSGAHSVQAVDVGGFRTGHFADGPPDAGRPST